MNNKILKIFIIMIILLFLIISCSKENKKDITVKLGCIGGFDIAILESLTGKLKEQNIVLDLIISKDPRKPRMILKNLNTGKEVYTRIKRGNHFINDPFKRYSILKINKLDKENKVRPNEEGKWVKIDEYEDILNEFEVIEL